VGGRRRRRKRGATISGGSSQPYQNVVIDEPLLLGERIVVYEMMRSRRRSFDQVDAETAFLLFGWGTDPPPPKVESLNGSTTHSPCRVLNGGHRP